MNIPDYIKTSHIHKVKDNKVVLKKFTQDSFAERGISATIYEDSDLYFLWIALPFTFNDNGRFSIGWGEWLQNILAIDAKAFGIELFVSIRKGGTCNVLMNNPDKPFISPDYPKLPIIAPPGELKLSI